MCTIPPAIIVFMFAVILINTIISGVDCLIVKRVTLPIDVSQIANDQYSSHKAAISAALQKIHTKKDVNYIEDQYIEAANIIISDYAIQELRTIQSQSNNEKTTEIQLTARKYPFRNKPGGITSEIIETLIADNKVSTNATAKFLTNDDSMNPESAGILGGVIGTITTIIVFLSISAPIGIAAGMYLSEIIPRNSANRLITTFIVNLASVPTVVYGLLSFAIFVMQVGTPRSSALLAGITLSLIALPTIIVTTMEAANSVPRSIKEAALALGASKIQTILHHTIPAASSHIVAGILLSVARVVGETTPLALIGMLIFSSETTFSFLDPSTTIPIKIFLWLRNSDPQFINLASAAVLCLILILAVINLMAKAIEHISPNMSQLHDN